LKLSNGEGAEVTAQFYEPNDKSKRHLFDFMACHYDVIDIFEAKHPYELEEKRKEYVVLRLDAEHHGLGTGSCGPKTLDQYALKMEEFEFGFVLF
jgi:beta-galactosidase